MTGRAKHLLRWLVAKDGRHVRLEGKAAYACNKRYRASPTDKRLAFAELAASHLLERISCPLKVGEEWRLSAKGREVAVRLPAPRQKDPVRVKRHRAPPAKRCAGDGCAAWPVVGSPWCRWCKPAEEVKSAVAKYRQEVEDYHRRAREFRRAEV